MIDALLLLFLVSLLAWLLYQENQLKTLNNCNELEDSNFRDWSWNDAERSRITKRHKWKNRTTKQPSEVLSFVSPTIHSDLDTTPWEVAEVLPKKQTRKDLQSTKRADPKSSSTTEVTAVSNSDALDLKPEELVAFGEYQKKEDPHQKAAERESSSYLLESLKQNQSKMVYYPSTNEAEPPKQPTVSHSKSVDPPAKRENQPRSIPPTTVPSDDNVVEEDLEQDMHFARIAQSSRRSPIKGLSPALSKGKQSPAALTPEKPLLARPETNSSRSSKSGRSSQGGETLTNVRNKEEPDTESDGSAAAATAPRHVGTPHEATPTNTPIAATTSVKTRTSESRKTTVDNEIGSIRGDEDATQQNVTPISNGVCSDSTKIDTKSIKNESKREASSKKRRTNGGEASSKARKEKKVKSMKAKQAKSKKAASDEETKSAESKSTEEPSTSADSLSIDAASADDKMSSKSARRSILKTNTGGGSSKSISKSQSRQKKNLKWAASPHA